MGPSSRLQLFAWLLCLSLLQCGFALDSPQPKRGRSSTVQGINPIKDLTGLKITSMGRNLQFPKPDSNGMVSMYRAESDMNRRLGPNGILEKNTRKSKSEPTLFMSVGNSERAEAFNEQSRARETLQDRKYTNNVLRGLMNSRHVPMEQKPQIQKDISGRNMKAFGANGQTVKHTSVPARTAFDAMLKAKPEKGLKKTDPVLNVDLKAKNQIGIRSRTLQAVKAQVGPMTSGMTYNGKRRSNPPLPADLNAFGRTMSKAPGALQSTPIKSRRASLSKPTAFRPALPSTSIAFRPALPSTSTASRRASLSTPTASRSVSSGIPAAGRRNSISG